jgi:hypothetical protein
MEPPPETPPLPPPNRGQQGAARRAVEARAQALTEWRRIDLRRIEAAMRRADRRVGDVLPSILGRIRIDQRQSESQILEVWKRVIDPCITAHARPVSLARGTVFVAVDSSVWLSEIVRYHRTEILERLQLAAGKDLVQRISFRIG